MAHRITESLRNGYENHLDQGYIKFRFDYYDQDGRDDYLDYVTLSLNIGGRNLGAVLYFGTDDQKNDDNMWIDQRIENPSIICKAYGIEKNGNIKFFNGRFVYNTVGDWSTSTVYVYFSPDILMNYQGQSFSFSGHVKVAKNARNDTHEDVTINGGNFPRFSVPTITSKLSSKPGFYEVSVSNSGASNSCYFDYSGEVAAEETPFYVKPALEQAKSNVNFDATKPIENGNVPYYFTYRTYKLVKNPNYIAPIEGDNDDNHNESESTEGDNSDATNNDEPTEGNNPEDPNNDEPTEGDNPDDTDPSADVNVFGTVELCYDYKKWDNISIDEIENEDKLLEYINERFSDDEVYRNPDYNKDSPMNTATKYLVVREYKPIDVVENTYFNPKSPVAFGNCPYKYEIDEPIMITTYSTSGSMSRYNGKQGTIQFHIGNAPKTLYIKYYYVVSEYQTCVKTYQHVLQAYQFPEPKNVTFENLENGATKISWTIDTHPNEQITGDGFEVIRSLDNTFLSYDQVADPKNVLKFDPNKNTYSIVDQTGKLNINGPIYYRIRRTETSKTWQWDLYTEVSHYKSMKHANVINGLVEFNYNPNKINGVKLTINLDSKDNYQDKEEANSLVLTENSKIVVIRKNITKSTEQKFEIPIKRDDYDNWILSYEYEELITKACNEFEYWAYVSPGSKNYSVFNPVVLDLQPDLDKIVAIESGNIENLEVSTGYYSDRVDLRWDVVNGALDSYSIERKEFGQPDEKYNLIENVEGAPSASKVLYSDQNALIGKIYSYRVTGKAGCASQIVETAPLTSYGFRTQTGDFFGQVTFENNQGEDSVEIRVETKDYIPSSALALETTQTAKINNNEFLNDVTKEFTFQAWVKPTSEGKIFEKSGMYSIEYIGGKIKFTAGNKTILSESDINTSKFTHITAGVNKDSLFIFINGDWDNSLKERATITSNNNQSEFGENFAGYIDEVRIFSRSLSQNEIASDYNRYILGDKENLILYYNFNYCFDDKVFDMSYLGSDYNKNDATTTGIFTSEQTPTQNQLWYKAITDNTGHYSLRGVPFIGNGTAYTLIPRKGTHEFSPTNEVRYLSENSTNYTINFVDKSSFEVSGTVVYYGGTTPVKGVSFKVDGALAMDKYGMAITTDENGQFKINVPVGVHEVKCYMNGHTFANEGRFIDSKGNDLNYQDILSGLKLHDSTFVKYVGRICGGSIQSELPVGFSLSKNNLSDELTITLTCLATEGKDYNLTNDKYEKIYPHFVKENSTKVEYDTKTVKIYPDKQTGEFVAYLLPEEYKLNIYAGTCHNADQIEGNNSILNLKGSVILMIPEVSEENDTVMYNQKQVFTLRYTPQIEVLQSNFLGKAQYKYFGEEKVSFNNFEGNMVESVVWSEDKGYTFDYPVFESLNTYYFTVNAFEEYRHCENSDIFERVPTSDAKVTFTNQLAATGLSEDQMKDYPSTIELDTMGFGLYAFKCGEPELTSGLKTISAKFVYGNSNTSINWDNPLGNPAGQAYVLGSHVNGADFVTAGPIDLIAILRDPPGTNSYSYIEKGTTITKNKQLTVSVINEGDDLMGVGTRTRTSSVNTAGTPATQTGTVTELTDEENKNKHGLYHKEEFHNDYTWSKSVTLTTRYQTSDSPDMVGADADLFIGNSTNVGVGTTNDVVIIPRDEYEQIKSSVIKTYKVTDDYAMIQQEGINLESSFGTVFAYSRRHIAEVVIPQLEEIRNNILIESYGKSKEQLQTLANSSKKAYYYSTVAPEDETFGTDETYQQILPNDKKQYVDTIKSLNQSIDRWLSALERNDKEKIQANNLVKNFSFEGGGSNVEYSMETGVGSTENFYFTIALGYSNDIESDGTFMGVKREFHIQEKAFTEDGYNWTYDEQKTNTIGFVLVDENPDDYFSVDVFHKYADTEEKEKENKDQDSFDEDEVVDELKGTGSTFETFIFRTRGGVSSCPYEGETKADYWKGHENVVIDQATKRLEVPQISIVDGNFREYVPSGDKASFKLSMKNNSEAHKDVYFYVMIDETSNPDGAILAIDGTTIGGQKLQYLVPAGEEVFKTLTVEKGTALNYDDLKLIMLSQCQDDIADTVSFTVHFTPTCTNVELYEPEQGWKYNTELDKAFDVASNDTSYFKTILIDGFDVNYTDFEHIELQYKAGSESKNWTTLISFYADEELCQQQKENGLNVALVKDNLTSIGRLKYDWFFNASDNLYDVRAVSVCKINNEPVYTYSEIASGVKDMYRPRLFGNAEPADGVLDPNDVIKVSFNESILGGYLTQNSFSVTGIRNGAQTNHSTAIELDGKTSYMETEFDRNLKSKGFTIETWFNKYQNQNGVIFSHGVIGNQLELKLNENNTLTLSINGSDYTSKTLLDNGKAIYNDNWYHVALVQSEDGFATVYFNFEPVITNEYVGEYTSNGKFVVGSALNHGNNFNGAIDNARIWTTKLTSGQLQINSNVQLSGSESGLLDYYPMDEGRGNSTSDRARSVDLHLNNCQWVLPKGYAVEFNGNGYLELPAGAAVTTEDNDFTLEFWFKTTSQNGTIIGNGLGDGTDFGGSNGLFNIGFENNTLTINHNGFKHQVPGTYNDGAWHQMVYTLSRSNGRAYIYMDAKLQSYFESDNVDGLQYDKLYAGARVYQKNTITESDDFQIDNYIVGAIDEIKVWKLYKPQTMVEKALNEKNLGNEIGLQLYYPFEYYFTNNIGLEELGEYSLDKTTVNKIDKYNLTFVNSSFTSDHAPLKDAGSVSQLNYTYVYSDDAIVINLTEPADRIENTIVTFTVQNVYDLNGNKMLSPITWTAYINKNQLVWDEDLVELEKGLKEPLEYKTSFSNKGGSIINYQISNLPSWMKVAETTGTINPVSTQNITFVVDQNLGTGVYDQDIYLTNLDTKVTDILSFNITVNGDKPEWKVNPSDYQYNMVIICKMRFNGVFSTDKRDMIAAFHNDTCVGVGYSQYSPEADMWYVMLTVYGNKPQIANYKYRMWCASTGLTYQAEYDKVYSLDIFKNDNYFGTPATPVIFDGKETRYESIHLNKNWNWISFNLTNENLEKGTTAYLGTNFDKNDLIKSLTAQNSYSPTNKEWQGSNLVLDNQHMYMFRASADKDLSISGSLVDIANTPILAKANQWSYISYLPLVVMETEKALADYDAEDNDIIKGIDGFSMYYRNNWIGNLDYMEPGRGYMIFNTSNQDKTFHYSAKTISKNSVENINHKENIYADNMNIIAKADIEDNQTLYAVDSYGKEFKADKVTIGTQNYYFITVGGQSANDISFVVRDNNNQQISDQIIKYQSNKVIGDISAPFLISFDENTTSVDVYPTIVDNLVNINAKNIKHSIQINIFDALGRQVYTSEKIDVENNYQTEINTSNYSKGLFVVKVIIDNKHFIEKFIKK
ncbi:MAG: T9SS type A sorting domain-containing protein [Bacteroidales bacterium]|nr:T9SS type A sorting domain-containing protein [Bacteroidales bacterium]